MTSLKYCGVCGSNEDRPENKLIVCISCGIACHYHCHCQTELDEKGQWQCKNCELSDEHSCTDCCYCYNTNPLIYKTIARKNTLSWAHVTCVFSRLYFNVNNHTNPCEICGSYDLYICKSLQSKYYHMSCALTAGYKVQWSECIDNKYLNNDNIRILNNKEVSISTNMFLVIVNDEVDINQAKYFSCHHNSDLSSTTDQIPVVMRPITLSNSSSSSSSSSSSGYQLNPVSNKRKLSTIVSNIPVPYLKSALKMTSSSSSSATAFSSASLSHTDLDMDMDTVDKGKNISTDNITTSESIGTILTLESSHSTSSSSSSSSSGYPCLSGLLIEATVAPNPAIIDYVATAASTTAMATATAATAINSEGVDHEYDRDQGEQQQSDEQQLAVPPPFAPTITHPTATTPDTTQLEVVELRRTVTLLASSYEWLEREMKAMGQTYDQLKRDVKKLQPVVKVCIYICALCICISYDIVLYCNIYTTLRLADSIYRIILIYTYTQWVRVSNCPVPALNGDYTSTGELSTSNLPIYIRTTDLNSDLNPDLNSDLNSDLNILLEHIRGKWYLHSTTSKGRTIGTTSFALCYT